MAFKEQKFVIDGSLFKISKILAENEAKRFDEINKYKEKQCKNSFNSCFIGILSERAVQQYLQTTQANEIKELVMYGIKERNDKKFYNVGDIVIKTWTGKQYKTEVKGITKGQPRGQITTYHNDKYLKERVAKVVFVEVSYSVKFGRAECTVYLDEKPRDIKTWNLKENRYNVKCHTHPKYI